MDIYYENSAGIRLDLDRPPYNMLSATSLFDYEWQEDSEPRTPPRRASGTKEITLVVTGTDRADYEQNLAHLLDTIDMDAMNGVRGRLYVGESYLSCYMSKSVKPDKYINVKQGRITLTVKPDGKGWIRESLFEFRHSGQQADDSGLGYPYGYPYNYRRTEGYNSEMENDALSDCDFTMTIYGPVMEPEITIGGASYFLHCEVQGGERAVIDTMARKILLADSEGVSVNIFRFRDSSHIFDRIPPGTLPVYWNGAYDFDLRLYEERGEPVWT